MDGVMALDSIERMFDYEALSRQLEISPEALAVLIKEAHEEFPGDEMMAELHVIRALRWLKSRNTN